MRDPQARLEKLIALAQDQKGTPEGEIAARLARKIMAQQRVESRELDAEQRNEQDPFMRASLALGGQAFWRRRVASITARHCECLCSFVSQEARLSGRKSAVLVAAYLYRVMSRSIAVEQAAWLGAQGRIEDSQEANNFAHSAVLALENRLQAIRNEEPDSPDTTALVRADQEALRAWLRARGVILKKDAPFPFAYSQDGYEAGYRVPLQKAVRSQ